MPKPRTYESFDDEMLGEMNDNLTHDDIGAMKALVRQFENDVIAEDPGHRDVLGLLEMIDDPDQFQRIWGGFSRIYLIFMALHEGESEYAKRYRENLGLRS
jgi:hypothetical protein